MKKLAIFLGMFVCSTVLDKPSTKKPTQIINNYYIKSGCSGKCGGHCHGGH